uniref:Uncharacterized protein n=1 Tax=Oryza brachyantha TaxID=4533 RepID=J3NCM0_ORYBR
MLYCYKSTKASMIILSHGSRERVVSYYSLPLTAPAATDDLLPQHIWPFSPPRFEHTIRCSLHRLEADRVLGRQIYR